MRSSTVSFLLACVLSSAVASAQPAPRAPLSPAAVAEARDRFNRGVELYDDGNYDAAMAEFLRAYELTSNPEVLFNISATHERSGHFVEALDAMLDYERRAPAASVASHRSDIDTALARLRQRIGTIVVRFDAEGLDVRIDNLQRPATESRTGLRVPAGRHRVSLSAPHYQTREEEFDIAGGNTIVIAEPLVPERAYMAVDCNLQGAEVLIDGRPVATTPVTSPLPVPEGSHHVVVRRAGYTSYETDVNSVGAGARVRAQLAWSDPIPQDVGARLVVQASEPNIVTLVDGRRVAPDGHELVPPGPHHIRVERNDFLPEEREVNLAAAQDNTISVFLNPTPEFRERYNSEIRTRRIVGISVGLAGLAIAGGGLGWFFLNENDVTDSQTRLDTYNSILNTCRSSGQALCSNAMNYVANENLRNTAQADNDNALVRRYVAIGVAGLGGAVAIAGIIVLATGPSSSRFERRMAFTPMFQLQPGLQTAGFQVRF